MAALQALRVGNGAALCLHTGRMYIVEGHWAACMGQCSPLVAAYMQAVTRPTL